MARVSTVTLETIKKTMTEHMEANVEEMKRAYNLVVNQKMPLPPHAVEMLTEANARADAASMVLGFASVPDAPLSIEGMLRYAIITGSNNSNQTKEALVVLLEAQEIVRKSLGNTTDEN